MTDFILTASLIFSLAVFSGCAANPVGYWYQDCDESTFEIQLSAGGLGQILDYKHTYKGKEQK